MVSQTKYREVRFDGASPLRPKAFEYRRARTRDETLNLLKSTDDCKILAGGQSLLALMKLRLGSPKVLIDINGLTDLNFIKEHEDGSIAIGALTRHHQIETSDLLKRKYQSLVEAAELIGDPQIRSLGTIGGSLAHADPSADFPPTVMALNADLIIYGPKGERTVKAKDFFIDFFATALDSDELLTEIRIPNLRGRSGTAYLKFSRRHGDFAIVNVAATLTVDEKNVCQAVSVAMGGVGSTPIQAKNVEKELIGEELVSQKIEEASNKAIDGIKPGSDTHASGEYRREISKVLVKRALFTAFERSKAPR